MALISEPLGDIATAMRKKLDSYSWGRTAREGFTVAIVGAPNVGKSSLLNRLSEENRAIVSSTAGTTRDTIEVSINALGVPVRLVDTAGLRASDCEIEEEGVLRARQAAGEADLILALFDGSRPPKDDELNQTRFFINAGYPLVSVLNKADLGVVAKSELESQLTLDFISLSALTGEGVETLLETIRDTAWAGGGPTGEGALTRKRHRDLVENAVNLIDHSLELLVAFDYVDAAASELHLARRYLSELLGWGTPEDVIEKIFAEFCIGK
jgi:tRNA modification GTPase